VPLYPYRCENGHDHDHFYWMTDERPASIPCPTCTAPSVRIFTVNTVQDDFPEHYNVSLGCVVKNRQHMRQLQREKGCHDWEPIKDSSLTEKQRKGGNW
jgi:hypothetical protein